MNEKEKIYSKFKIILVKRGLKMLDYRIETFMNLCQTKSYTATSKALNITQPAVSGHIRYLEQYYGVKLADYKNRQFTLTAEGEFLYREMVKVSSLSKGISRKIKEIHGNENFKKIVLSSNMTMGEYVLPSLVASYSRLHPDHRLCTYIASGKDMEDLLNNGKIDYAIVDAYAVPQGMDKEIFTQDYIYCVCNPKHPLAGQTVSLADLKSEDIIFREKNAAANNVQRHLFAHHGYNWDEFYIALEAGSMFAIERYLEEIPAISFIYAVAAIPAIEAGRLSRIYVPELKEAIDYYFVFPDRNCLSKEAVEFMEFTQSGQALPTVSWD